MDEIRRAARSADKLAWVQFSYGHPEIVGLFEELGIDNLRGYFVLRASPMGRPNPALIGAAFAYFPPVMVSKIVSRSWESIPPERALEVGVRRMSAAANAIYVGNPKLKDLADRYEQATAAVRAEGRALTAAWQTVEWSDEPAARLFGAATVLREFRGDAHIFALARHGLSPLQGNLLSHALRSKDIESDARGRGFRDDAVIPARADLEERGAIEDDHVTKPGAELWEAVEETTDVLGAQPWEALGDELDATTDMAAQLVADSKW